MSVLQILSKVFLNRQGITYFVATFIFALTALFIFTERLFFLNVFIGNFPLHLFLSIIPDIFNNFLFGKGYIIFLHYILIAILFSIYATLILYIFLQKKYFSLSSFSISIAGIVGISFGISCISCGALAGLLLLSMAGSFTSTALVIQNNGLFLFFGEGLLLMSIVLALLSIKRFTSNKV